MSDALKKMGEQFRVKREKMNLTLKEVENATSIRMIYLQAIEDGNVDHFISNVYALGFIRQYANFIGFEKDSLNKEFPDALRLPPENQDFAYGIGTLETRGSPHGGVRWLPNLFWVLILAAVLVAAYFFAKFVGVFK